MAMSTGDGDSVSDTGIGRKRGRKMEEGDERGGGGAGVPVAKAVRHALNEPGATSDPTCQSRVEGVERNNPGSHCLVFIVDKKISSGHLKHLKSIAARKKIPLASSYRSGMGVIIEMSVLAVSRLDPVLDCDSFAPSPPHPHSDSITHVVSSLPSFECTLSALSRCC